MKIAVLGWGSLIWNPTDLKIEDCWKTDGPFLPIEFARISKNWPLTLVVYPNASDVQVLWAFSAFKNFGEAIENLRYREGTSLNNIGFVCLQNKNNYCHHAHTKILPPIKCWAANKSIDAVIWTDLCSNFKEKRGKEFNEDNVIEYLRSLNDATRCRAKEYICKAPKQIETKIRGRIAQEFGWIPENYKICY